ncbi:MAG: MerR family transcriptional regulator [Candidatus Adiutrix sp.]
MTAINVWEKVNLSIDQVSQLTGVKKTTLRYWEKEFSDYLKPERTETQRRQYSLEEVEKVSVLKQLIEDEKYKSAGVRLKLGLEVAALAREAAMSISGHGPHQGKEAETGAGAPDIKGTVFVSKPQ